MKESKLNKLIQQGVDGSLPEEEHNRLDKLMQQNPHLRLQYTRLKQISEFLNQVGAIEAPSHLRTNILKKIDYEKYRRIQIRQNGFQSWLEWFLRPKPRVVLAFCSGIIIGGVLLLALLAGWFSKYPLSNLNLTGTIGMSAHPLIENLYDFTLPGGKIKAKRFDQLIWLEMNFSAGNDLNIKLEYDPGILEFEPSRLFQSERVSIQISDNQLEIKCIGGGQAVIYFVKSESSATIINVTVGGGKDISNKEKIQLD